MHIDFTKREEKTLTTARIKRRRRRRSRCEARMSKCIFFIFIFSLRFFSILCLTRTHSIRFRQQEKRKRFSAYFVHPSANVHHINMQSKNTNLSIQFDGRKKSLLSKQCTGNWRNTKSKRKINYDMPNEERQLMCFCVYVAACDWRITPKLRRE